MFQSLRYDNDNNCDNDSNKSDKKLQDMPYDDIITHNTFD